MHHPDAFCLGTSVGVKIAYIAVRIKRIRGRRSLIECASRGVLARIIPGSYESFRQEIAQVWTASRARHRIRVTRLYSRLPVVTKREPHKLSQRLFPPDQFYSLVQGVAISDRRLFRGEGSARRSPGVPVRVIL